MWNKSPRNRYSDRVAEFSVVFLHEIEEKDIETIKTVIWM